MTNTICTYEDCNNQAIKKGYCNTHYNRIWRNGDLIIRPTSIKREYERICTIKDCGNTYYANGYCEKHNRRNIRHNNPIIINKRGRKSNATKQSN